MRKVCIPMLPANTVTWHWKTCGRKTGSCSGTSGAGLSLTKILCTTYYFATDGKHQLAASLASFSSLIIPSSLWLLPLWWSKAGRSHGNTQRIHPQLLHRHYQKVLQGPCLALPPTPILPNISQTILPYCILEVIKYGRWQRSVHKYGRSFHKVYLYDTCSWRLSKQWVYKHCGWSHWAALQWTPKWRFVKVYTF